MLKDNGERFLPWGGDAQLSYEHIHRYAFAATMAKGKRVLDLASGEGYGSHLLSLHAERVTGVDIDRASVDHARSRYGGENLEFL
ncbi:MAG: class I SAM-dependent methyltransferase, partial [Planctomycetota bacterium]